MGRRLALLIASYDYQDPGLRRLTAPARDAEALAEVLEDPQIAGFEVTTLINEPHYRVGEAIGDFYRHPRRDDTTLLYFTGHGLKDDGGRLYLAMNNTRRDSLLFTSLPAEHINQSMEGCVSRHKVLVLDCCYSGAFPEARLTKGDSEVHALERFQGRGRTVLTASDSTQYSFEGNRLYGEAAQSVFTRYLVEGLRDGTADLDGDGDITVDELYSYVHDRVVEEMPEQRPKKQDNVEGRTVIARNIHWSLPRHLRNNLDSPIARDKLLALEGLVRLATIGNGIVRAAVRDEVERLVDDDSRAVSAAAVAAMADLEVRVTRPVVIRPATKPVVTLVEAEPGVAGSSAVGAGEAEPVVRESVVVGTGEAEPVVREAVVAEPVVAEPVVASEPVAESPAAEPGEAVSVVRGSAVSEPATAEVAVVPPQEPVQPSEPIPLSAQVDAWLEAADRHELDGELTQAEALYRRAADAGSSTGMYGVAAVLERRGELADAEIWYRRALEAAQAADPVTNTETPSPSEADKRWWPKGFRDPTR
jgi:caspase domain-containing protein